MNKPLRGTRLLAGVALGDAVRYGLIPQNAGFRQVQPERTETDPVVGAPREAEACLHIQEPAPFHWARYEHLRRRLRRRFHLAAALLTALILIMLGWKAEHGDHISTVRWFCGVFSGWFIVAMIRLALFTHLAAPRFICYARGHLRISGLGTLRAAQILHWSIERKVRVQGRAKPGAKVQICCRCLGWERHWTMLMEEGPETERLQHVLETQLPRNADAAVLLRRRTIQIEAGILSQ